MIEHILVNTVLGELKLKLDGDSGEGSQLAKDPLATVQRVLEHCKVYIARVGQDASKGTGGGIRERQGKVGENVAVEV